MTRTENCGKCKKPKSECKCGRPEVITKEVLQKLKDAFMYTFTDEEACLYAGISTSTLYNYQQKYPEFLEIKQSLRLHPNMNAKKELVDKIKGNLSQAQWWAKHSKGMRADFGELQEIKPIVPLLEGDGNDAEVDRLTKEYNENLRALYAKGPRENQLRKDENATDGVTGEKQKGEAECCNECVLIKSIEADVGRKRIERRECSNPNCPCHRPKKDVNKQNTQVAKRK